MVSGDGQINVQDKHLCGRDTQLNATITELHMMLLMYIMMHTRARKPTMTIKCACNLPVFVYTGDSAIKNKSTGKSKTKSRNMITIFFHVNIISCKLFNLL